MTLFVIYGSLVPLHYRAMDFREALRRFREVPFFSLHIESRADWVANILLFVPLAWSWMAVLAVDCRRIVWKGLAAGLVAIGCVLLSVALEFTQLWFPPRTVSQNDIVAEALGGMLGVLLWLGVGQALSDWLRTYTAEPYPSRRLNWLLEAYFLGFLGYSLMPLDLTVSSGELVDKYRQGKMVLLPYSGMPSGLHCAYALLCDFVLFMPIGALIATWRMPGNRPCRRIAPSLAIAAAVASAIEIAQLFVYSRYSKTGDVITDTAGALLGILVARRCLGAASQQGAPAKTGQGGVAGMVAWLAAAALYASLLLVVFWWPFEVLHDSQQWKLRYVGFWALPFERLYYGSEFHALSEILRKVLFFAPLGGLLAAAGFCPRLPPAIRRLFIAILFVLAVGAGIGVELGQVFLVGHYADCTDATLYATGTAMGMLFVSHILRRSVCRD